MTTFFANVIFWKQEFLLSLFMKSNYLYNTVHNPYLLSHRISKPVNVNLHVSILQEARL